LQEEVKTLMAQKQAYTAQSLIEKSGSDSKVDELLAGHKAEMKKLSDELEDST
jgi:hypothetical protein